MDKQNYYNDLCDDEQGILNDIKELNKQLSAIRLIKQRIERDKMSDTSNLLFDPSGSTVKTTNLERVQKNRANKSIPAWQRVLFSLDDLKQGTTKDVAIRMRQRFPVYTEDRANNDAKYYLSFLKRKGKITAEKVKGTNGYLYKSLVDEKYPPLSTAVLSTFIG